MSPVSLSDVLKLKAAEKAAKDAFFSVCATVKPGSKIADEHKHLQAVMIAATKARQDAMVSYAATL